MSGEAPGIQQTTSVDAAQKVGWIGAGRMGSAMAQRLIAAGGDLAVYNRTRSKAEPLAALGATLVDTPRDLGSCDIVFSMMAGPESFLAVMLGENGLLTGEGPFPRQVVDCSTISAEASEEVREVGARLGVSLLDAPVSGNAKVVEAGKLAIVCSGEKAAFDAAEPFLKAIGEGVTYAGEGNTARIVKICHNVHLTVVIQSLVEILALAEKSGVPRHALMEFINNSVMGSKFTGYKTPALVKLDYTPTFTAPLLRKDMDLGLSAARELEVPMPVAAQVREILQALIGNGFTDCDFAALLEMQARASNLKLEPEEVEVGTGL
jgi:3-hydroxyisobutyrate dehydrogenase-like beta-hydroxyacid dehydrogenase